MSKFNDVKVGDKVLCPVSIRYGFNSNKHYHVQKSVTRLTTTQIVIGDKKFYKEDGREVGGASWDKIFFVNEAGVAKKDSFTVVQDQTQEYIDDAAKIKKMNLIQKEMEVLEASMRSVPNVLKTLSVAELENTYQSLVAVNQKLNPEPVVTEVVVTTTQEG